MDAHDLNLDHHGLALVDLALTPTMLVVRLATTAATATCPRCGAPSDRVHSRYTRTVADLPAHDRRVVLRLRVRRFRCATPDCPRAVFCERLPGLVAARSRTTDRLTGLHRLVGLALGGEPGARLADRLAIPTSPDTLLRRVKDSGGDPPPPARFVGIDDWAWRKGRRYGTIVVDLERGRVVDLLPDRDAATVAAWLADHPGVELISRDRWSDYARAAAEAAPKARQVADRWHLLKNLREAIERLFERRAGAIEQALAADPAAAEPQRTPAADGAPPPEPSNPPDEASPRQKARLVKRRRRAERFERVHELHRQGRSVRGIAQQLGLSRNAVRRYLRRAACPDWRPGRVEPSKLDEHREWIDRRLREGGTNAAALHREMVARGCRVSYGTVRRLVARRLAAAGTPRARANAARPPTPPRPSAKRLSFDWVCRRNDRDEESQARLEAIRGQDAELAEALGLADEFAALVRKQACGTLADWLTRTEASVCSELRRFAEGVRRDESAVQAAVTEAWSNGPVEGQVNRLKVIKRQMYGRAGLKLLRARVIHAA